MKKYLMIMALLLSLPAYAGPGHNHGAEAHDEDKHEHGEDEHEESHGDSTEIKPDVAEASGIKLAQVGATVIESKIKANGTVALNQNNIAKVKARFPGVVKSVTKSIGEKVAAGEVLATVESNESLQVYAIKSPISGTVVERNLNIGDEAAEQPIMVIADLSKLWAEFYVFSKDAAKVEEGQKVIIKKSNGDAHAESKIASILPYAEGSSQTLIARALINNDSGKWRSGYSIRAEIVTSETEAKLAVKTSAIQKLEGKDVVFVNEGGKFEARVVTIANANDEWSEIATGLHSGETYVAEGSFIIKAEIGKSSAEHAH